MHFKEAFNASRSEHAGHKFQACALIFCLQVRTCSCKYERTGQRGFSGEWDDYALGQLAARRGQGHILPHPAGNHVFKPTSVLHLAWIIIAERTEQCHASAYWNVWAGPQANACFPTCKQYSEDMPRMVHGRRKVEALTHKAQTPRCH